MTELTGQDLISKRISVAIYGIGLDLKVFRSHIFYPWSALSKAELKHYPNTLTTCHLYHITLTFGNDVVDMGIKDDQETDAYGIAEGFLRLIRECLARQASMSSTPADEYYAILAVVRINGAFIAPNPHRPDEFFTYKKEKRKEKRTEH